MTVPRRAVVFAAVAAACLSVAAMAQPGGKAPKNPSNVEQCMHAIEEHLDGLSGQLGKPDALKTVWEIERLALLAKTMTPEHLKGGASAANLTAYRKAQVDLMKLLLQLETNVLENKPDEARRTIDALESLEKESHKKFRAKEGRK
jgi:hypothetical protein